MMNNIFTKGDSVNCKKWNGTQFLAIYEYMYEDGSHCVVDVTNGKRFNIHHTDIQNATEEEIKQIKKLTKQNNVKPCEHETKTYTIGKTININEELNLALEPLE